MQEPHGRAAPAPPQGAPRLRSAPPRSAPQLTRRPPPCPGRRRLCPQQARLRGERADADPDLPLPLPASVLGAPCPALPSPAWPGPARPCAAPPPCRAACRHLPLKAPPGRSPRLSAARVRGAPPCARPEIPAGPGGGRGLETSRCGPGRRARAPAGRAVTERARPLAEAAPIPPQRRVPPRGSLAGGRQRQPGPCRARVATAGRLCRWERPAGGWRCARRPQPQGEKDLSSCGAGEGARPAVSVPASSW